MPLTIHKINHKMEQITKTQYTRQRHNFSPLIYFLILQQGNFLAIKNPQKNNCQHFFLVLNFLKMLKSKLVT